MSRVGPESRKDRRTGEDANTADDNNVCKYERSVNLFFSRARRDAPEPEPEPARPPVKDVGDPGLPLR